jgi:tight adherence protein C
MIIYAIAALTTLTILAGVAGVYHIAFRSRRIAERLNQIVDHGPEEITERFNDTKLPIHAQLIAFLGWVLPGQVHSEILKWDLARAGYRHTESRGIFVGVRVALTGLFAVTTALATWRLHLLPREIVTLALLAGVVGYFVPMMFVRLRQSKRIQEITLALPDALDLLVICVEAGQGLNAALVKVGREVRFNAKTLGEELQMVNTEMLAGVARTQALRNFSMRTGVDDVRALVAVMVQSDRFGTSIVNALRSHADSLRIRRRQRAEETARKTPVKLVFPLVFCIFPELLVVILAPGMLALFRALSQMGD